MRSPDIEVMISADNATPAVQGLRAALTPDRIRRAVAAECVTLTQNYLRALPPNKRGWPSTGFYGAAADGTDWTMSPDGIVISIDNKNAPGAMKFRYYGGTITMKDKLLTIPARQEFYGHRATEFTNLRFVMFSSGAKALVVGKGGAGRVNFSTGKEMNVKGAGARTAMMIAYWLVEQVTQQGDFTIIPTRDAYYQTAIQAVVNLVVKSQGRG